MAKTLAGVLAVSIAGLLFTGCGGGSSKGESSTTTSSTLPTTTTAAKTVVSSFCLERYRTFQEMAETRKSFEEAGFSEQELKEISLQMLKQKLRILSLVWSDGSITESKEQC
jgi:hypothetical protein